MLALIPQPQRIKELPGQFVLPGSIDNPGVLEIGVFAPEFSPYAEQLGHALGYFSPSPGFPVEWFEQQPDNVYIGFRGSYIISWPPPPRRVQGYA